MNEADIIDDVISNFSSDDLPLDYVLMARVVDISGKAMILSGDEFSYFIQIPFRVSEVRVVLDVNSIKEEILENISDIFAEVEKQLRK